MSNALIKTYNPLCFRYPEGAAHLPFHEIVGSMERWRQRSLPPLPGNVREMGDWMERLPIQFLQTDNGQALSTRNNIIDENGKSHLMKILYKRWVNDANTIVAI